MEVTVNLNTILWLILTVLGVGVLVVIFTAVQKLNETLKIVQNILTKNEENIDESLKRIPNVLSNVEEITTDVNEEMKHVKNAFKNIDDTVEYTASAVQGVNEDIIEPIRDLLGIVSLIADVFGKPKKKGIFKK
ncbi:hypothetical protein RH915_10375 [Serpentinicella sp. ANB-PHB4]|uniref:hypothetical protein n=1 Tax=Serpentinicella sp. ANB-PHB4 TaxID=3074076 RepID=UPI002855E98C|nr:hypothetical protein [Serpentinicella sp. ANB-PHB4]MDR5659894.1 hypothetical protein [Serpentinicella sp. ANB-PHB4]